MTTFTSTFISTVNIGSWDYYIFSDNTAIWRSLNGLAAWFGGSGAMVQGAAWLGSLILLAMILFAAATHKQGLGAGTLGVWFFFMAGMGITGQANVYNIYTNQVTVVQNVPALALVPASIFSKTAYKVLQSMETVFQSTTGSYMAVSQNGFLGPLDILLTLRSKNFPTANPLLVQNLSQTLVDCGTDPVTGTVPPVSLSKTYDVMQWFQDYGRQTGLTKRFTDSNPTGYVLSCLDSFTALNTDVGTLASGNSDMLKFVNSQVKKPNPQSTTGAWGAGSISGAYDMLVGAALNMNQNALQFTKNALVASTVIYTKNCLETSGMLTSGSTCETAALGISDSMETWKTQAAMDGQGFLKTMMTSMGVLQALFFALFPIIALYGLIVVNNTTKIYMGYIFFGIWIQSWLLVVVPIQAYMQTTILDEVSRIAGGPSGLGGMALVNANSLYMALSTKLAVASDIMASAQLMSLAILSGSMVALSGLAQKWSGERHNDPSNLQHGLAKSAPVVSHMPAQSVGSIIDKNGHQTMNVGTFGSKSNYSIAGSSINSQGQTASTDVSSSAERGRAFTNMLAKSHGTELGLSKTEMSALQKSLSAADGFSGQTSAAVGMAYKAIAGDGNSEASKAMLAKLPEIQRTVMDKLAASDSSFLGKLTGSQGGDAQIAALDKLIDGVGTGLMVVGVAAAALPTAGAGAVPALAAGAALRATGVAAAKELVKGAIKRGGTAIAAGALTKGGVGAISDALLGDTKALYKASIDSAMSQTSTNSASKTVGDKKSLTNTATDAITKAWKDSTTQSNSTSNGDSATRVFTQALDSDNVLRFVTSGYGDLNGEQFRTQQAGLAARNRDGLSAARIAEIDSQVKVDTQNRSVREFGQGADAQAKMDAEKNVLFNRYALDAPGPANNTSLLADKAAALPTTTTIPGKPATQGHWEKIPAKELGKGQKIATDRSLASWGKIDGESQSAQEQAGANGLRWVKGTAATPSSTVLTDPTKSAQTPTSGANQNGFGGQLNGPLYQRGEGVVARAASAQETAYQNLSPSELEVIKHNPGIKAALDAAISKNTGSVLAATAGNTVNKALTLNAKDRN